MTLHDRLSGLRLLLGINIFWLALSALSDGLSSLALPARLLQLGVDGSATAVGLITAAGLFLAMLVQPIAGHYSDRMRARWGRRGTLTVGVAFCLLGLALFGAGRGLVILLASYLLIQGAASVAQAAQQGFIPDLVEEEGRGAASGLKSFMDIGGALIGFLVLGQLMETSSATRAIAALFLVVLVAFMLTVVLVREPERKAPPTVARPFSLRDTFRLDMSRHRPFLWLTVARFLFLLGTYAVGRFLLLFVAQRLGLSAAQAAKDAGLVLATLTGVTVVLAIPAGWGADRWGRMPLMVTGALLSAAGVLLLVWAGSKAQIMFFGGLMGAGSAAFAGANWAMTADLVPGEEAGRFFALANFGTAGATAAAGLFGPLVDWGNRSADGAGFVVLFLLSTLAFLASLGALKRVASWQRREASGLDAEPAETVAV